jgi:hypothetical protein
MQLFIRIYSAQIAGPTLKTNRENVRMRATIELDNVQEARRLLTSAPNSTSHEFQAIDYLLQTCWDDGNSRHANARRASEKIA